VGHHPGTQSAWLLAPPLGAATSWRIRCLVRSGTAVPLSFPNVLDSVEKAARRNGESDSKNSARTRATFEPYSWGPGVVLAFVSRRGQATPMLAPPAAEVPISQRPLVPRTTASAMARPRPEPPGWSVAR
jgi:hypothetical protein